VRTRLPRCAARSSGYRPVSRPNDGKVIEEARSYK
jgi:hypothetical protein